MSRKTEKQPQPEKSAAQRQAEQPQPGLVRELAAMILHNKKWWLIPILATILALGLVVYLGGTAAAPFIYSLF